MTVLETVGVCEGVGEEEQLGTIAIPRDVHELGQGQGKQVVFEFAPKVLL